MYTFIFYLCINDQILEIWDKNLCLKVKDEIFDAFWHEDSSFFSDSAEEELEGLSIIVNYLKSKNNDEFVKIIEKFFTFLKENEFYREFWKRFNIMFSPINNSPLLDLEDQIKYTILVFATSSDINYRKIFIDFVQYKKKSDTFAFSINLSQDNINKIINTGYYSEQLKNQIVNYNRN